MRVVPGRYEPMRPEWTVTNPPYVNCLILHTQARRPRDALCHPTAAPTSFHTRNCAASSHPTPGILTTPPLSPAQDTPISLGPMTGWRGPEGLLVLTVQNTPCRGSVAPGPAAASEAPSLGGTLALWAVTRAFMTVEVRLHRDLNLSIRPFFFPSGHQLSTRRRLPVLQKADRAPARICPDRRSDLTRFYLSRRTQRSKRPPHAIGECRSRDFARLRLVSAMRFTMIAEISIRRASVLWRLCALRRSSARQ